MSTAPYGPVMDSDDAVGISYLEKTKMKDTYIPTYIRDLSGVAGCLIRTGGILLSFF